MFAKVAVQAFTPAYELLDAPHSLQHQSKCGRQPDAPDTCGPHASGCGMAWRNGDGLLVEKRGPEDRWDQSFVAKVRGVSTPGLIAHNRLASPGLKLNATLAHPFLDFFQGVPVAFCHNGGVRNLMDEARSEGVTDSQLFFRSLLSLAKGLDHASVLAAVRHFAKDWSYTSLSGMLLTPDLLHVWRCYDATDPRKDDFERYYTLWVKARDEEVSVASEAVDESDEWKLMPNRTLLTVGSSDRGLQRTRSEF
jgi:predicted glutamine amidotransferase